MTREKAIIILTNTASLLRDGTRYMKLEHEKQFREAYETAIKALEQPERKKGRWYKPTGMMPPEYAGRHRCSECDGFAMHDWKTHREVLTDFCPWCNADMREGREND